MGLRDRRRKIAIVRRASSERPFTNIRDVIRDITNAVAAVRQNSKRSYGAITQYVHNRLKFIDRLNDRLNSILAFGNTLLSLITFALVAGWIIGLIYLYFLPAEQNIAQRDGESFDKKVISQPAGSPAIKNGAEDIETLLSIKNNIEIFGQADGVFRTTSIAECEQMCNKSNTCKFFTRNKSNEFCFLYPSGSLRSNPEFDSGPRTGTAINLQFKP